MTLREYNTIDNIHSFKTKFILISHGFIMVNNLKNMQQTQQVNQNFENLTSVFDKDSKDDTLDKPGEIP